MSVFDAAERKARAAAREGLPESSCPYPDRRKHDGRLTFSRAWRNAWIQAYRDERVNMGDCPPFK